MANLEGIRNDERVGTKRWVGRGRRDVRDVPDRIPRKREKSGERSGAERRKWWADDRLNIEHRTSNVQL